VDFGFGLQADKLKKTSAIVENSECHHITLNTIIPLMFNLLVLSQLTYSGNKPKRLGVT